MLTKKNSLVVSEVVFSLFEKTDEDFINRLSGYYDVFNNCRETGLVLKIYKVDGEYLKNGENINIWVHESRNSDYIVVRWGKSEDCDLNNMFSEKVYKEQGKSFLYNEHYDAALFIKEKIIDFAEYINSECE